MDKTLQTQISLVLSKYEDIEDDTELISLIEKEFKVTYTKEDIFNHYVSLTELEIANREIEIYGHFNEYTEFTEL